MRHPVAVALIVVSILVGGLGLSIFLTERGVANEIKGFVLMLIAAVFFVGGCVLLELGALRRTLEQKDPR